MREERLGVEYELDGNAPRLLNVHVEMGTPEATREDVRLRLRALSKGIFNLGADCFRVVHTCLSFCPLIP